MFLLEIDSTNEHNKFVDEWSAHGQSDINLEHKGQVVADTGINRLIRTTHPGMICTLFTGQTSKEGIFMRYSYEFKRKCIEMYYQGLYPDTPN